VQKFCACHRSGAGEPARRGVHQRAPAAQPHPAEDRGAGGGRRAAVRHLAPAARFARLRLQNLEPLPGDGLDPTGGDRGQQAARRHPRGRAPH